MFKDCSKDVVNFMINTGMLDMVYTSQVRYDDPSPNPMSSWPQSVRSNFWALQHADSCVFIGVDELTKTTTKKVVPNLPKGESIYLFEHLSIEIPRICLAHSLADQPVSLTYNTTNYTVEIFAEHTLTRLEVPKKKQRLLNIRWWEHINNKCVSIRAVFHPKS